MPAPADNPAVCPKCSSDTNVRAKKILIGKASPELLFNGEERSGYRRHDQLAVDECKLEMLNNSPLEQFVDGFYCEQCGIGFVADDIVHERSSDKKRVAVERVPRYMTEQERLETGRAAFELQREFGLEAHVFAARRVESALQEGDEERAQFWTWVEAALKPR